MPASTVHAVLTRCRLNRLSHVDRRTGEPIHRYEHERPGSLVLVDVKKLGNIPDGGGWRYVGKQQGERNCAATSAKSKNTHYKNKLGHAYVHSVLDDCSRVVYAETVLSDNGPCYKSFLWRDTCAELRITHKRTRPYRPQTNGKIERFQRTLSDGWAYSRLYASESARRSALAAWIHEYNHHRPHTAIGKVPPITRLTNLAGQYRLASSANLCLAPAALPGHRERSPGTGA